MSVQQHRVLCRHCLRNKSVRPRGLCFRCYYLPGVRDLYPSTSKYARRGVRNFNGDTLGPDEPTEHPPASPEKVDVLAERARLGQSLWHPQDADWVAWDGREDKPPAFPGRPSDTEVA